jgi:hypothetical protein
MVKTFSGVPEMVVSPCGWVTVMSWADAPAVRASEAVRAKAAVAVRKTSDIVTMTFQSID